MHDHLTGPFWGNAIVIALAIVITIGCFAAMVWMMFRPGEREPDHPKYDIFRDEP